MRMLNEELMDRLLSKMDEIRTAMASGKVAWLTSVTTIQELSDLLIDLRSKVNHMREPK